MIAQGAGEVLSLLNSGGVVAMLVLIIYTGITRKWVFGWQYQEAIEEQERLRTEMERWQQLALKGTRLAEKATRAAEKTTRRGSP